MYRRKYGGRPKKEDPREKCEKEKRGPRGCHSYGKPRRRPRASVRDLELLCLSRGKPDKHHKPISQREPADSDSDVEEVAEVAEVEVQKRLHVTGLDLHIDENTKTHHTEQYECTEDRTRESDNSQQKAELVIRRGQEFKMTINFDRPYDIQKNDITLAFNLGDDLKVSRELKSTFKVDETGKDTKYKPKKWGATVIDKKDNSLTLNVFVPASAPVGEWEFSIRTIVDVKDGKDLIWQYNHDEDINILFNPWCKEDWVFLKDEEWRNEAVLNDSGAQYYGSWQFPAARNWFFGQFEDGILDTAYHLVRKAFNFKASPAMGNPASVARLISQIVNDCDDDGVLVGNWTGDYEGGTSPTSWNGSVRILREYMKTGKPVKYGQCWVFSAVVTAVCRALGIPCRSVTNFASAHNTDMDHLSIDKLVSESSKHSLDDSIWNFHVWNEVWMSRPDLGEKGEWDGWQVIDATPQECSDGVFCCGPAPVKAVKEGELRVGKDTAFIFAEVNADKVIYEETHSGTLVPIRRDTCCVGKIISTHRPTGSAFNGDSIGEDEGTRDDRLERLDLTDFYKYKEGSEQERKIVHKAEKMFRVMNGTSIVEEEDEEEEEEEIPPPPLNVKIEQPLSVFVGNPFEFKVEVVNTGSETVAFKDLVIKVFYKTYSDVITGVAAKRKFKDLMIDGGKSQMFKIAVDEDAACARPQDNFNFEVRAVASFFETDHVAEDSLIFRLRRPDIVIRGPSSCSLGEEVKVELSFTNPLKVALTDCVVEVDGGLTIQKNDDDKISIPKIGPKDTWKQTVTMTPKRHPRGKKDRSISVGFSSKKLQDISGFWTIQIKDK